MKGLYSAGRTMAMLTAALFGFLLTTQITVSAQSGSRPSSIQRRVDQLNRQREEFERDNLGREVTRDRIDRKRSQALLAEVKKDLASLQANYNQIVIAMAARKSVDDDQIVNAIDEIKHCSGRLKHNLALPEPKDDQSKPTDAATAAQQTEAPLMTLRKHIFSFVMNPLFETPAVIDVEHAKNASRDLDKIIELSELLSKHHAKKKLSN